MGIRIQYSSAYSKLTPCFQISRYAYSFKHRVRSPFTSQYRARGRITVGLMHFADLECAPQLACRPGVKIEVSVRIFAGVTQDGELPSRVFRDEIGHVVHLPMGVYPTAGGCVVLFYLFECESCLFLSIFIFSSFFCP